MRIKTAEFALRENSKQNLQLHYQLCCYMLEKSFDDSGIILKCIEIANVNVKLVSIEIREEEKSRKRMLSGFYYSQRSCRTLRSRHNKGTIIESCGIPVKKAGVIVKYSRSVFYIIASAACCAKLAGVRDFCVAVDGASEKDIERLKYICRIYGVKKLIFSDIDEAFGLFSDEARVCCFPEDYTSMILSNRYPYVFAEKICIIKDNDVLVPPILSESEYLSTDIFSDDFSFGNASANKEKLAEICNMLSNTDYDAVILLSGKSGIIERKIRGLVPIVMESNGTFEDLFKLGLPLIIRDPLRGRRLLCPDDFACRPVYVRWK